MGIQQKNLSIVFRALQPEVLFQSICDEPIWNSAPVSVAGISSEVFHGLAHTQYPSGSYEEIESIRQLLLEHMKSLSAPDTAASSVFHLLVRMGKRVFRELGDKLVCNFSQMLAWQNVYQKLGQDLFTTAYLAHEDILYGRPPRKEFAWEAVIKTDNHPLNTLLRQGIAENHCHLGGTTQNFPLSWACVMNYPHTIHLAANKIKQNLQANYSRGVTGNVWPWEKRLQWASYLRIELFKRLEGETAEHTANLNMDSQYFYPMLHIKRELHRLKICYGAQVPQKGGATVSIDYALRSADCKNGLIKEHNRLLSGERSFLYRCFRACFDGTFSESIQNWFYMYLLIKENFRAEFVQVNRQAGFRNFKDYQDRKDSIYDGITAYQAEAIRLSVNANLQNQNLNSFEVRIAPKDTAKKMRRQIQNNEALIDYASKNSGEPDDFSLLEKPKESASWTAEEPRHFYVYHFIKSPDPPIKGPDSGKYLVWPRNQNIRTSSCQNAKALRYALQRFPDFCTRVWGIDAANTEIGCRPEVFATTFRYLKDTRPARWQAELPSQWTQPHIFTTYHVGEDFLDLVDGLRAIDEAVKFLHLERGDRLGHALALGVEPARHYTFKNHRAVLPKQDLLDNVVWLLYRAQGLGVEISPQLRTKLKTEAERYLSELYGNHIQSEHQHVGLYEYYCAMQLRGDAPELYRVLPYKSPKHLLYDSYERYMENPQEDLNTYRRSTAIAFLYQCYHFSEDIRKKGREAVEFKVGEDYIALVRKMQDGLAHELMEQGIMIECNPTSNYLIGTFRRYDEHPIFRFNNVGLVRMDGVYEPSAQLSVSVNTDDLGVFDTSLENEYAILAAGLERMKIGTEKKYSHISIYDYLDRVRKMGIEQSFLRIREHADPPTKSF